MSLVQVNMLVRDFCDRAQNRGELAGVALRDFPLNPPTFTNTADLQQMLDEVLAAVGVVRHFVSLEQHRPHGWNIYWSASAGVEKSLLCDAPLDVRLMFLHQSEAFVSAYEKKCTERPQEIALAYEAGLAVLTKLRRDRPSVR